MLIVEEHVGEILFLFSIEEIEYNNRIWKLVWHWYRETDWRRQFDRLTFRVLESFLIAMIFNCNRTIGWKMRAVRNKQHLERTFWWEIIVRKFAHLKSRLSLNALNAFLKWPFPFTFLSFVLSTYIWHKLSIADVWIRIQDLWWTTPSTVPEILLIPCFWLKFYS